MRWFTLALCLSLSLAAEDGSLWTSESNVPWGARAGLVAESVETATNKMMFVVGGSNATSHLLNDVYRSTDGTTWQLATSAASWTPRTNPALGDLGDKVLLTGGSEGTTFFNSVYSTTDGATWTELTSNAPWGGRRSHSLATINGTILLMGGFKGATSTTTSVSYNDVWKSSDGVTWTELTSRAPWRARKRLSARTLNGQVVVCGGATASIVRYNDVWVTWDGIQWSNMTDAPWTPRQGQRSAIRGGRMWLIGGDDGTFLNDVWSTDNARNWIQATSQASWLGRTGFALAAMGHNMIVTGGSGNTLATQFLDGLYINAESAQTPMISPDGRTLEKDATVTVSMMTKTAGAAIHYVIDTKDNTMPDQSSTVYDGPIILKAKKHTQTIKAVAYKDGLQPSGVAMQTFVGYDPSSAATRSAPLYFLVLAVSALFTLV